MAKMFPDFIHPDCKSAAEKKIYLRLKREVSDEYIVLHSLGLPSHPEKLWGEVDFVVIGPRGILCIEVKGGKVSYQNGKWYFTNRYGETNSKAESPMDQSRKGMYALRGSVREEFGGSSPLFRCVYGYATFFVDQDFDQKSGEWDLTRVTGYSALSSKPLDVIVRHHLEYSCEEITRVTGGNQPDQLSATQVEDLRKFFRRDFDLVPSLGTRIDVSYTELIRLTRNQLRILDQLLSPRLLVRGGAGTGKTLLALEKARRHFHAGERVLFLCFNSLLACTLSERITAEGFDDLVRVSTLHALCHQTVVEAGLEWEIPSDVVVGSSAYFSDVLPELFPKAFCQLYDESPFDVLIVDEGQDFKGRSEYMELLDWLIVGGLKKGRWAWFEDDRQSIFNQGDSDSTSDLERFDPAVVRLIENCRNTAPVASFVSVTTQTDLDECLQDEGPEVKHLYYSGAEAQMRLLDTAIREITMDGVPVENIVVLSASREGKNIAEALSRSSRYELEELKLHRFPNKGRIGYTTAGRFKGLESRVVIVTDVESLDAGRDLRRLYVAMTRANAYLVVLMKEGLKAEFGRRYSEYAKGLLLKNKLKREDGGNSPFAEGI